MVHPSLFYTHLHHYLQITCVLAVHIFTKLLAPHMSCSTGDFYYIYLYIYIYIYIYIVNYIFIDNGKQGEYACSQNGILYLSRCLSVYTPNIYIYICIYIINCED